MLAGWSNCREYFRRQQIEKIEPVKPSTYYTFGTAIHRSVEAFWRGESYEKALDEAYQVTNTYPVQLLNPPELDTWERLVKCTPDVLAVYYDSVHYDPEALLWVEKEWSIPYADHVRSTSSGSTEGHQRYSGGNLGTESDNDRNDLNIPAQSRMEVILCGRMDRLMAGPRLVDVKTASEISQQGVPWRQQYRQDKVLDLQFALYDWYLAQMCKCGHSGHVLGDGRRFSVCINCECTDFRSMAPIEIYLE